MLIIEKYNIMRLFEIAMTPQQLIESRKSYAVVKTDRIPKATQTPEPSAGKGHGFGIGHGMGKGVRTLPFLPSRYTDSKVHIAGSDGVHDSSAPAPNHTKNMQMVRAAGNPTSSNSRTAMVPVERSIRKMATALDRSVSKLNSLREVFAENDIEEVMHVNHQDVDTNPDNYE
jgi:hypothetical protein